MKSISLLLLLMSPLAQGQTLEDTTRYIRSLESKLGQARIREAARLVYAAAQQYGINPLILAGIVHQESNFRSGLKQCWSVYRHHQTEVTCDYGLAQVNELWIRRWNLDPDKLQNDDAYNLCVAARILKSLRKTYEDLEPSNWWGRYHSGTPSVRATYEGKLMARMAALN